MENPIPMRTGCQLIATLPAGCTILDMRPEADGRLVIETDAGTYIGRLSLGLLVIDGDIASTDR
jgi:hypothetical protein